MSELMSNIKNLRGITGAGFVDCKNALEENNNDIDKSIDFLRKKGLAKASKKSSREANEGAVGFYSNKNFIALIQINTETDFAAKNEVFLNFMNKIGNFSLDGNKEMLSIYDFNNMSFDSRSISDQFKDIIAKIGENIILSKLLVMQKTDETMISHYIHNSYASNVGKIAVVIKSKVQNINQDAELLGKNLCMHVAASKPLALNINNLSKELIEKEREVQLHTIKASGKPENIIDKILEGKMKKFYSESTFMDQQYILDQDKTVNQIIIEFSKNNKFEVIDYNLFVIGS